MRYASLLSQIDILWYYMQWRLPIDKDIAAVDRRGVKNSTLRGKVTLYVNPHLICLAVGLRACILFTSVLQSVLKQNNEIKLMMEKTKVLSLA